MEDTVVEPLEGVLASEPGDQTPSSSGRSANAANVEHTFQWVKIRGEGFTVPEAYRKGTHLHTASHSHTASHPHTSHSFPNTSTHSQPQTEKDTTYPTLL